MVNIAIIGCGSIVLWRHGPECRDNENIELKGFYDINYQRAVENAEKFGGKAYKTYEAVLADKEIEAVIICTANRFHCEMTVKALESGKHVLCEKPMALTEKEAKLMVDTAEKCGKYLMIAQSQRTDVVSRKAKELLGKFDFGKVLSFRASFANAGPDGWSVDKGKNNWFFDKSKAGFGALGDLGIHKIDLLRWLLQEDISYVTATVRTLAKRDSEGNLIGNDDTALCILETESGIIGTVEAGWAHFGRIHNEVHLFCENGTMEIYTDYPAPMIKIFMASGETAEFHLTPGDSLMSANFAKCIMNNEKPEIDGVEGLKAIQIVNKCLESSEKGLRICLNTANM